MELMDLYAQVKSPFSNTHLIGELIKLYLNSANHEDFYEKIMFSFSVKNCYSEDPLLEKYAMDRFYTMIFNQWKNQMLETNINQIPENKYDTNKPYLSHLQTILRSIPDINSLNDIKKEGRDEVNSLLERYKRYYTDREWTYVNSYYINPMQEHPINIEHFLYLNINSKADIYKFSQYFIQKCNEKNLAYDFKFTTQPNYDDVFIISSSTETLINYIDILREIKSEYPEVVVSIKRPHILTGKIDEWIGYGTAPQIPDISYIKMRSNCIYKVIDNVINNWFIEDVSEKTYVSERISYKEYIAKRIIDSLMSETESNNRNYFIQKYINKTIEKVINELVNNNWKELFYASDDLKVHISSNKFLTFNCHRLKYLMKVFVQDVVREDPDFILFFNQELMNVCDSMGIDYKSFCFDKSMISRMENIDNAYEEHTYDSPSSSTFSLMMEEEHPLIDDDCEKQTDYWIAPDGSLWASYDDYLNRNDKIKQYKI